MTKIVFDLVSVVGQSHPDDAVTFRAPFMRRSKNRQGIVTTRRERLDAPAGAETAEVEPGPIEVEVWAGGEFKKLTFDVPDTDTIYLSDYIDESVPLGETTIAEFRQLFETIAADTEKRTAESARQAEQSSTSAGQSEGNAARDADRAETAATTATTAADNAEEYATAATTAANNAATSEGNAARDADRAETAADNADESATRVATIADSTRWVGTQVEVNGKLSPDLKGEQGERGPSGEGIETATYSAEPNTLMKRTSTGAVSVADPTASVHAANKRYVDATVTGLGQPMTTRVSVRDLVAQNREGLAPSHPYTDPADNDVQAMRAVVTDLLQRNTYNPADLPQGAEVIEGWDDDAKRAVWVVRSTPGNGLYWGMWVLPHSAAVSAIVESPHPVFDGGSDDIAYEVWRRSPLGTVLAVAGSHRTNPDGTDPRDVCKNKKSMWHRVTTYIAQPGLSELQIHGFGDSSLPGVGAVVSSGSSPLSAGVIRLNNALHNAGIVTARQWDGSATKLIGMFNAQGDAAAVRGNAFCHIELSGTTRDSGRDAFVQAVTASGYLANRNSALITNEYPKAIGSANSRGEATTAARADHTHRLVQNDPVDGEVVARTGGGWRSIPAAEVVQTGGGYTKPAGGIPVTDQEKSVQDAIQLVKSATYSATGGTLMKRTSTGAVSVADPTAGVHAANKNYVDTTVANATPSWDSLSGKPDAFPPTAHTHTLADINGVPSDHTSAQTASTLMSRDENGRSQVQNPSDDYDIANKQYVDAVAGETRAYADALIVEGNTAALDGKLHIVYE